MSDATHEAELALRRAHSKRAATPEALAGSSMHRAWSRREGAIQGQALVRRQHWFHRSLTDLSRRPCWLLQGCNHRRRCVVIACRSATIACSRCSSTPPTTPHARPLNRTPAVLEHSRAKGPSATVPGTGVCIDDPADLHPRDVGLQRCPVPREGVWCDQRYGRDRRGGGTADRRADHDDDQLAGLVPAPGCGRRSDHLSLSQAQGPASGGPDTAVRHRRCDPLRGWHVIPRHRDSAGWQQQHASGHLPRARDRVPAVVLPAHPRNRCCPPACFATARPTSVS